MSKLIACMYRMVILVKTVHVLHFIGSDKSSFLGLKLIEIENKQKHLLISSKNFHRSHKGSIRMETL